MPTNTLVFQTQCEQETESKGAMLALQLGTGSVVGLCGELGTGKTCLVRGLCKSLGVKETVCSPTFALLNVYESGRIPVYHYDVYRLKSADEAYDLGIDEYFSGQGICVVEWAEKIELLMPEQSLWVHFRHIGGDKREIRIDQYRR